MEIPQYNDFDNTGLRHRQRELRRMFPGILQLHIFEAAKYVDKICYEACKGYGTVEIPAATTYDYENAKKELKRYRWLRSCKLNTTALGNMAYCALYHPNATIRETWFNCFTMLQNNI